MKAVTFRRLPATACALLVAGAVVGCSTQVDGTGSASGPVPSKGVAPASSSVPVTTPTKPSAKDGTDYSACLGGDCEIAVSKPVTIKLSDSPVEGGPFEVQTVGSDSVGVSMGLPGGPGLGATIKKGCTTAFFGNNDSGLEVTSCSGEPDDIVGMYVKEVVTVEDITDGTAILTLKAE